MVTCVCTSVLCVIKKKNPKSILIFVLWLNIILSVKKKEMYYLMSLGPFCVFVFVCVGENASFSIASLDSSVCEKESKKGISLCLKF